MVQGSMSCVKYLMFFFNFIFVICGLVLVIVGGIMTKKDLTAFVDSKFVTAAILLIVVGCFIFLVAFLGCCGAIKENHCMVMTFGFLVFVIFIVEVAGGITAYMYRDKVDDFLKTSMNSSLAQQKADVIPLWNDMQTELKCCGVSNYTDYENNDIAIPRSCCPQEIDICTVKDVYKQGCYHLMLEQIIGAIKIIGGVAIGIGVVELLGCMFAWCLASAIKRDYEGV